MSVRFARAGMVAVVLVVAGCTTTVAGSPAPLSSEVPMTTPLAQRPSIDIAVETYDQMQAEIREAVSRVRPETVWSEGDGPGGSVCDNGTGNRAQLLTWISDGAIDGAEWEAVLDVVTQVAGRYEFELIGNFPAQATNKTVIFDGPYGATLEYGNQLATVLSVTTGCHPD